MWVVRLRFTRAAVAKRGGVKADKKQEEAKRFAEKWPWAQRPVDLIRQMPTVKPVTKILVESCTDIAQELYWVRLWIAPAVVIVFSMACY